MTALKKRVGRPNYLLAMTIILLLGFTVPLYFYETQAQPGHQDLALSLINCLIASAGFGIAISQSRVQLFQAIFWLFSYIFLGLAPLAQRLLQTVPSTTPDIDTSKLEQASLAVLFGMLMVGLGTVATKSRDKLNIIDAGQPLSYAELDATGKGEETRPTVQSSPLRLYVFTLFALLSNLYFVSKVGASTLLSDRTSVANIRSAIWPNPITNIVVSALSAVPLVVCAIAMSRRSHISTKPVIWRGAAIVLGLLAIFATNPINASRYQAATVMLSLVVAANLCSSPRRFRICMVAAAVSFIYIFPLADTFRRANTASTGAGSPLHSLTSGDYDSFSQIVNTLSYTAQHGSTHGRQFLGVVTVLVPRTVWPGKPLDTGILLANFKGYAFTNLSAPVPAELLINGGWPLLILGMFGVGYALTLADRRSLTLSGGWKITPLTAILPVYLFILLRGSLLQAMAYLIVILVSAAAVSNTYPKNFSRPRSLRGEGQTDGCEAAVGTGTAQRRNG